MHNKYHVLKIWLTELYVPHDRIEKNAIWIMNDEALKLEVILKAVSFLTLCFS